ncbi:MAG TPA: tetratricopeptide repeat protein, partial [Lacipirellulaceae bacterium]|nr:tetratricopeptide repeat protein [Lacipirellulaceae bacterium]
PLVRRTLANAFYQQGRYEEAVTEYREVLRLHPEDVETLIYYGYALLQLGQLEASVAALREATRVAPSVSRGWVHLGTALRRLGKIEESIEALRMAVQVDPEDDGYLHMQLGNALYEHGSRDEATRVFQKMMTLMRERREREPGNHDVLRELAGELATCRETSLRDYDEAVQIMEQAVELAPESSKNWRMLGVARYRAGQFREAVEAFERAGDDGPDMSWPFFYRAMAEWRLGNHEAANDWYAKGIHWMEQHNQFTEPARVRLRDEAAGLLGIASPADARVDEVANASPLAE